MTPPIAIAIAVVLASSTLSGSAMAQDSIMVPPSIASDCSSDVSVELGAFLNGLPDNSLVQFPLNGCFRTETQIDLVPKSGMTIEGNGTTLKRTQSTPWAMRYPNSNAFLRVVQWHSSTIRGLNIQGINLVSDEPGLGDRYGAWDQSMEFDAGINLRGGQELVLEGLHIDGTYGDGIQIQRWGGNGRNITVRDVVIGHNGRQGISISAASGVLIDNVEIQGSRRGGIDMEPDAATMVVENVEIRNSTISSWLLAFPSWGQGLVNHIYIHDNLIKRTGVPFVKVGSTAGLQRTDWRVMHNVVDWTLGSPQAALRFDNTTNVLIDGNVMRIQLQQSQLAVSLGEGSTATISNNWFQGALAAPGYVQAAPSASWVGGNNSVDSTPPSATRWTPAAPPTLALPGPVKALLVPVATVTPPAPSASTPSSSPSTRSRSRLVFQVTGPVREGRRLTGTGRLLRGSNAASNSFFGYPGRAIDIQFRPAGTKRFLTVAKVRTGARGRFTLGRQLAAMSTGSWRARFHGDARYRPSVSSPDKVRVLERKPEIAPGAVLEL